MAMYCHAPDVGHLRSVTSTFQELLEIPSPEHAFIVQRDDRHVIDVLYSQRDVKRGVRQQYRTSVPVSGGAFAASDNVSDIVMYSPSPSGRFLAVLRSVGGQIVLEVQQGTQSIASIPTAGKHGALYTDARFGVLNWSPDEEALVYIAEKNAPVFASFYDDGAAIDDKGRQFEYREDWGEKFENKHCARMFVCRWRQGEIQEVNAGMSDEASFGQALFTADGSALVFTVWTEGPKKLGLTLNFNRPCGIYLTELANSSTSRILSEPTVDWMAHQPRLSPDGSKVFYISSGPVLGHDFCVQLRSCSLAGSHHRTVVDIVSLPQSFTDFPGLFTQVLPRNPWLSRGKYFVTHSVWRASQAIVLVDVESGRLNRIDPDAGEHTKANNWRVLDAGCDSDGDIIVCAKSTLTSPSTLFTSRFNGESWTFSALERLQERVSATEMKLSQITATVLHLSDPNDPSIPFEAILLEPPSSNKNQPTPLVLDIHGGPHYAFFGVFEPYQLLLVLENYALLLVNYRGSIGLGQKCIESIWGKIGPQPSRDCDLAVEAAMQVGRNIDSAHVAVIGFSTGGMIAAQQICDRPDRYKAAILKNPNINGATLIASCDMPDWCWGECIGSDQQFPMTADHCRDMFLASPMAYVEKVRCPVMFLLGGADRRIPASQALQFRHHLRVQGIPTRTLFYPDDHHGLDTVATECDAWINVALWIRYWFKVDPTAPIQSAL
eukprot:GILK01005389.1.p1 GENE.GILK01005389.1~~GILK01005389.1.p1  ORF type:complete len:733 (+),score=99.63 GILK01005389.1:43-2199(+)